ncbi:signal peptidase I [Candidatus Peregrinibacteria bacterium]|nr:signal peptidase I [Candidatus Peregrinibacteria bacterium]
MSEKDDGISFGWGDEKKRPSEKIRKTYDPIPQDDFFTVFKDIFFFCFDVLLNALIIIGLVFLIRSYLISPFRVFGPSMCDSLNYIDGVCVNANGEYIIVNKILYRKFRNFQISPPKRGDIIVFHPPQNFEEFYIKRIIGLPGEKIEIRDGYVYLFNEINPKGIRLEEPYLNETNQGNTFVYGPNGIMSYEVPENSYFLLGDNRIKSSDSRFCFSNQGGCAPGDLPYLPFENIEGKAWISLWPIASSRIL